MLYRTHILLIKEKRSHNLEEKSKLTVLVAQLIYDSNLYLTVTGIIMKSLKSVRHF